MDKRSKENKAKTEEEKETGFLDRLYGPERLEFGLEATLKKIIFFGVCLVLLTPLIINGRFFFPFVGPKSLYFMAVTELIFFVWVFLIIFFPKYRPRLNFILIALVLFLLVLTIASFLGVDSVYSFWSKFERMTGIFMLLHLLALFLIVFSTFKANEWIKIFQISICLGVILSLIAMFSNDSSMRGGATIGNSSFLGTYLLFDLFIALYLLVKMKGGIRFFVLICFLIMAFVLFKSGARAAMLSFFGGLGLLFILYLAFVPKIKSIRIIGKILLLLAFLAFIVSAFLIFKSDNIIHQKFIEQATRARLVVWGNAWQGFLEKPWLGWGPENFEYIFAKYFNSCMFLSECGGEIWFDRAHNIIFDTLATSGALGLISYALIFIGTFYILWRNYSQKKFGFWTTGIFTVCLIAYCVQNLTVFDMVNSYMMLFLILGFIASLTFKREESQPVKTISSLNPFLFALVLILFISAFLIFIVKPAQTDYYTVKTLSAQNAVQRVGFYKKALEASPVGRHQIRTFFAEQLQSIFQQLLSGGASLEEIKPDLEFLTQELEKSIKEVPLDYRSYLRLGHLLNIWASLDQTKLAEAEEILTKTIEIGPTNQQGYWALAQTKLYQGKFDEALSLAEKAVALEKRVEQSHLVVIQIAKFMGNEELVKKKTEEAIAVDPEWAPKIQSILGQ